MRVRPPADSTYRKFWGITEVLSRNAMTNIVWRLGKTLLLYQI